MLLEKILGSVQSILDIFEILIKKVEFNIVRLFVNFEFPLPTLNVFLNNIKDGLQLFLIVYFKFVFPGLIIRFTRYFLVQFIHCWE